MKEEKDYNFDRRDVISIVVGTIFATLMKHFVLAKFMTDESIWIGLLTYMLLFCPVYIFMLWIQGKFKKTEGGK